jgi:hypothetical protein
MPPRKRARERGGRRERERRVERQRPAARPPWREMDRDLALAIEALTRGLGCTRATATAIVCARRTPKSASASKGLRTSRNRPYGRTKIRS